MLFNIVARNQDDHVKNIAFLMDRRGNWDLAPAYDMTYAYNPSPGRNTSRHQMSANGMFDDFTVEDLVSVGGLVPLPRGRAQQLLAEVTEAVSQWPRFAAEADVPPRTIASIGSTHRLKLPTGWSASAS
jgi:serine/threonine-protein kinase HipA